MNITWIKIVPILLVVFFITCAFAEGVVIIHPDNQVVLSESDIKALFLGKKKTLSNGSPVIPLLPNDNYKLKVDFLRGVIRKNHSQYRAYWAKRVFTGKGNPPDEYSSVELLALVSRNPVFLSVIPAELAENQDVQILLRF